MLCEKCGDEHLGTYGSGRFCTPKCARAFSTAAKREDINRRVSLAIKLRYPKQAPSLKRRPARFWTLEAALAAGPGISRSAFKRVLLRHEVLPQVCAICGCPPEWCGKPLTLVLDHENGIKNDNRVENVRLVCPNCNSQLPTFSGRNTRSTKQPKKWFCSCGSQISKGHRQCKPCYYAWRRSR